MFEQWALLLGPAWAAVSVGAVLGFSAIPLWVVRTLNVRVQSIGAALAELRESVRDRDLPPGDEAAIFNDFYRRLEVRAVLGPVVGVAVGTLFVLVCFDVVRGSGDGGVPGVPHEGIAAALAVTALLRSRAQHRVLAPPDPGLGKSLLVAVGWGAIVASGWVTDELGVVFAVHHLVGAAIDGVGAGRIRRALAEAPVDPARVRVVLDELSRAA